MVLTTDILMTAGLGLLIGFLLGFLPPRMRIGRLEAEKEEAASRLAHHASDLEQLEARFSLQFENLANRIFDDKSEKFKKESQEGIGQMLNPLRERLQEFQKKIDDSFGAQAKEQFSLKNEIKNIVTANERMSLQTESLTKALKGDVKVQGNWGEVILEKVLEESGLRKGHNYITQGSEMGLKHAEDGSRLKPDVIILLPEDKHVIIDAKVSLTHYERFCAATDDIERTGALKQYLNSVRTHVTGLEERRYQDTDKLGTPDFVLMFMPIEGAYSLAIQQDHGLHSFAWDKKVIIVCPTTLLATLRTVSSVWRLVDQNKHSQEIATKAGALYDKIAGFVEDMEDIGKKIGATQKTYDEAFKKLSSGTGNILRRTEDLKLLGVKTSKKLPKASDEEDAGNVTRISPHGGSQ
jgi:DNA recombination protein RmuC